MLEFHHSSPDSFIATGIGFKYDYKARQNVLSVSLSDQEYSIADFHFDIGLSKAPVAYARLLDKACQIKALMYSGNTCNNMSTLLEESRLRIMLKNAARLSRYAYDLEQNHLERFATFFAADSELKCVKVKEFTSRDGTRNFFVGRVYTKNDNSISVRACTLTGLTAALSDRTLRDLIMMEFGHRFEASAHNLMTAATKLASISMILDENFVPSEKIIFKERFEDTL